MRTKGLIAQAVRLILVERGVPGPLDDAPAGRAVVSPTMRPRSWSCIAPETISEALALSRLTSTTSGTDVYSPSCSATKLPTDCGMRPFIETIGWPRLRNVFETAIA
jgi:hypothetical protein